MDSRQVPLYRLIVPAAPALLALGALGLLAGCGPRKPVAPPRQVTEAVKEKAKKAVERDIAGIDLKALGNKFTVDDEKGLRMLDAKVERVDGSVKPGIGMQGPVKLIKVKALLHQKGQPQLNVDAPEGTWDGKLFIAEKTVHAVTADGTTVIDAQRAVWTAATGKLDLFDAKLKTLKGGKEDFSGEAPRAEVLDKVITMPTGGQGRNPEGQHLRANRIRWNSTTGRLEAQGNVVLTDENMQVTGQRLTSNTKLKKGRLSGGSRLRMQKSALQAKNG